MRFLRGLGRVFWRFMIIFSFIVNIVLVIVLIALGLLIFEIKGNIADPLIGGLHSTAVGLKESTIDWTIPVRDSLGINLDVPINATTITSRVESIGGRPVNPIPGETVVRLTRPVPLAIRGQIDLGRGILTDVPIEISLPAGLELPVALDLAVNLETDIPVELDVRAVIPLSETQLNDPVDTLRLLFEPLAVGLHNLPDNFSQVGPFTSQAISGELDLLATDGSGFNAQVYDAWAGYSRTAGLNYNLFNVPFPTENRPLATNLAPPGGIPPLDAQLRPHLYDEHGNRIVSVVPQALAGRAPQHTFDGSMADFFIAQQGELTRDVGADNAAPQSDSSSNTTEDSSDHASNLTTTTPDTFGIIATPNAANN